MQTSIFPQISLSSASFRPHRFIAIAPQADANCAALLERSAGALRQAGYNRRDTAGSLHWIERFIEFHGGREPGGLDEADLAAFLQHLSRERKVAAATYNQALAAIVFLYRQVLGRNPAALAQFHPQRAMYAVPLLAEMGPGWWGWSGGRSGSPAKGGAASDVG
ncbi:MAG: hypothetical protein EXR27_11505 [Betaproteobacteria bacterium]|nr:hypothetical protein [Betaproteobacteria bacterium]